MLSILNSLRDVNLLSVFLRMLLACACGAAVGLERSAKNRPAGFRTHILVCLGASVASLSGLYLYLVMELPTDATRIAAQVISGLGFIGAGTIIVTKRLDIKGLTTAAGLWVTGIIGLAIGAGFYEGGIIGTLLVLLTETWFAMLTSHIQKRPEYILRVHYNEKDSLDQVLRHCKDRKMAITNLQIHSITHDNSRYSADIMLRGSVKADVLALQIGRMPGIDYCGEI